MSSNIRTSLSSCSISRQEHLFYTTPTSGCFRATLLNINSNETLSYPFTVSVNKCGGSCNTIDDPHARVWVPNKVKNRDVKLFDLMSEINKRRFLAQFESC